MEKPLLGEDHFASSLLAPLKLQDAEVKRRAAAWLRKLLEEHFGHLPRTPFQVHHYTKGTVLKSFLESNKVRRVDAHQRQVAPADHPKGARPPRTLWASLATHLNDYTELSHGQNLIWNAFKTFSKERAVRRELNQLEIPWSRLLNPRLPWSNIFVVCFTELEDSLSQWRGYGGVRGYSLTFDVERLPNEILLAKVKYDNGGKELRQTFERLLAFYREYRRYAKPSGIAVSLRRGLALAAAVHKQYQWRDEKEWRLLIWCERPECFNFRDREGRLIPYHLVDLPSAFRLSAITFGPGFEPRTEFKALKMLKERFRLGRKVALKETAVTLRTD